MAYDPFTAKPRAINVPAGYARTYKLPDLRSIKATTPQSIKINIQPKVINPVPKATPVLVNQAGNIADEVIESLPKVASQFTAKTPQVIGEFTAKTAPIISPVAKVLPLASKALPVIGTLLDVLLSDAETISSEDEAAAIKKAQDKLLQNPAESSQEVEKGVYPFTGGQTAGVTYWVLYRPIYIDGQYAGVYYASVDSGMRAAGAITAVTANSGAGIYGENTFRVRVYSNGVEVGGEDFAQYAGNLKLDYIKIYRADGQPDTGGNPAPISQPSYSSPGSTQVSPQTYQREVGDRQPSPLNQQFQFPDLDFAEPESLLPKLTLIPNLLPVDVTQSGAVQEPELQAEPLPKPNEKALDTAPKLGDVTKIYSPSADLGTIKITKPFGTTIPSPLPQGQTFENTGTDRTPQPKPVTTTKPATTPAPEKTELEKTKEDLEKLITSGAALAGLTPAIQAIGDRVNQTARQTTPEAIATAAEVGTCNAFAPNGCNADIKDNAKKAADNSASNKTALERITDQLANLADLALLPIINNKLGAQLPGGLAGASTRLSRFLGIDRIFNLLNFLAILHNASMLSSSLKVTLLETLSSVGNATGLLQTSEGDNVDLNAVFNQGIETFITSLIGVDAWASMKLTWRKYSSIYRAATNSLNAISSMFNSLGQAVETAAEYTGKIGNAIRAAGLVRENAYNFMSEKVNVNSNKYISFNTTVGNTIQVLETVNEIAENIVEGQQQYTEAVKATAEFQKQLSNAEKNPGIDNKAIKEEAEKIKANLIKDPTGEDEEGLLSFLTD